MASPVPVPTKSQQLHNFSLPQLKWNKTNNNNSDHHHRRRRAAASPPHHRWSPIRDSDSEHRKDDHLDNSEKDSKEKIYIRIRKSGKVAESVDDENDCADQMPKKDEIGVEKGGVGENCRNEEVEEPKTWNLRPRKAAMKG